MMSSSRCSIKGATRKGTSSGCTTMAIQKGAASKKKNKINFRNKPISNFDIMNWVNELKIKKL